jgi:hypothetical protein
MEKQELVILWHNALEGLAASVPFAGNGLAATLAAGYEIAERRRQKAFFEKLASDGARLTSELVESEDFLFCFVRAYSAAVRTRHMDKVALFANLLLNACTTESDEIREEFEDYLALLDSLTTLEMKAIQCIVQGKRGEQFSPKGNKWLYDRSFGTLLRNIGFDEEQAITTIETLTAKGLLRESFQEGPDQKFYGPPEKQWSVARRLVLFVDAIRDIDDQQRAKTGT